MLHSTALFENLRKVDKKIYWLANIWYILVINQKICWLIWIISGSIVTMLMITPLKVYLLIEWNDIFITFDTMGMIVQLETWETTPWEQRNLPAIILTSESWYPMNVELKKNGRQGSKITWEQFSHQLQ